MRKDYHFLIGQRFSVGGEIYVVQDLTAAEDRTYVRANPSLSERAAVDTLGDESGETFSLSDVIQWLLVEEEIVLFNPNYLGAR